MAIGIGQQCQITRTLDSGRQLTLIACFGAGNTAWNDLASFGDEAQHLDVRYAQAVLQVVAAEWQVGTDGEERR